MSLGPDTDSTISELVDVLEIAAVGTMESSLVNSGMCILPTVHMISRLAESPYVGYVISRPFYRAADAAQAIAAMGALPAAMSARRLVLVWENADLWTALDLPGGAESAAVVVDAGPDGHEVRWHPFVMTLGPPALSGYPTLSPSGAGPGASAVDRCQNRSSIS